MEHHIYYVTYSFQGGLGRIRMERSKEIDTFEDVISVEKYITENNKDLKSVFLTNWIKLKG